MTEVRKPEGQGKLASMLLFSNSKNLNVLVTNTLLNFLNYFLLLQQLDVYVWPCPKFSGSFKKIEVREVIV